MRPIDAHWGSARRPRPRHRESPTPTDRHHEVLFTHRGPRELDGGQVGLPRTEGGESTRIQHLGGGDGQLDPPRCGVAATRTVVHTAPMSESLAAAQLCDGLAELFEGMCVEGGHYPRMTPDQLAAGLVPLYAERVGFEDPLQATDDRAGFIAATRKRPHPAWRRPRPGGEVRARDEPLGEEPRAEPGAAAARSGPPRAARGRHRPLPLQASLEGPLHRGGPAPMSPGCGVSPQ